MSAFLYYPFYLTLFWYRSVIGGLFVFFVEFNRYTAALLSTPLLIKTFFKPLKNEYRDGLVLFSIIFGMILKTVLILVTSGVLIALLFVEILVGLFLTVLPIGLAVLLIGGSTFLK